MLQCRATASAERSETINKEAGFLEVYIILQHGRFNLFLFNFRFEDLLPGRIRNSYCTLIINIVLSYTRLLDTVASVSLLRC